MKTTLARLLPSLALGAFLLAGCADQGAPVDTKAPAPAQATSAAQPAAQPAPAMPEVAQKAEAAAKAASDEALAKAKAASDLATAQAKAAAEKAAAAAAAAKPKAEPGHEGHGHDGMPHPGTEPVVENPNSKAKLQFEVGSDSKNFGKVMQGDVLNHVFEAVAVGEEDLIIRQAKPTCGCTVADVKVQDDKGEFVRYEYGKPIAKGRKVQFNAQLHTQNKRQQTSSKVNISTNEARGQAILSLEAYVEPFFNLTPMSINFSSLGTRDTATDKITVTSARGDRIKLTPVLEGVPNGLKIELKPLDEDADGKASRFEVLVTAGPGLSEGSIVYSLALRSDFEIPGAERLPNGKAPTYEVSTSIMAVVRGSVSLSQSFFSFGLFKPNTPKSLTTRLTSNDPSFKLSPELVSVTLKGRDTAEWDRAQYFQATVRPVPNENSVDIELSTTGLPDSLAGSFNGLAVIKTGHPDKPQFEIGISGVCRGAAVVPGTGVPTAPKGQ